MIIFHDEVQKGGLSARQALLSFLNSKEPELVYILHHIWNSQQKAITHKEIREAILSGDIDPEFMHDWHQDYSRFVIQHLKPLYIEAMRAATKKLDNKYTLFSFDATTEGVKNWTDTMGAAFVTNSTNDQIDAIRTVVRRASQLQNVGVDSLARSIRAMVGLNKPQAVANQRYFNRMIEQGLSEKKALENSIKYSARQHRYRGHMIARTELAFAYNKGEDEGVRQAIQQGYMGHTVKKWVDAGDDRVCDTCKSLHRQTHRQPLEMDDHFNFQSKLKINHPDIDLTPPAHPHCRCVLIYEETAPPNFTQIK